jgi:hypothetical protein
MTNTPGLVKQLFAKELHRCCAERYSSFPSNEQLARDLYLSSKYSLKVSRETVRKWLKGDTFPDLDHLLHLINWLGLTMANVFVDATTNTDTHSHTSHFKYLDISSFNQITPEQIDSIVGLLNSLKNTEFIKYRKFS